MKSPPKFIKKIGKTLEKSFEICNDQIKIEFNVVIHLEICDRQLKRGFGL